MNTIRTLSVALLVVGAMLLVGCGSRDAEVSSKCGDRDAKCVQVSDAQKPPAQASQPAALDHLTAKHVINAFEAAKLPVPAASGGTEKQQALCESAGCLSVIDSAYVSIYEWPDDAKAQRTMQSQFGDYRSGRFTLVFHVARSADGTAEAGQPDQGPYQQVLDRLVKDASSQ